MNVIEVSQLEEVDRLLDQVLKGKVEYLKEVKKVKEIVFELIESRDIIED